MIALVGLSVKWKDIQIVPGRTWSPSTARPVNLAAAGVEDDLGWGDALGGGAQDSLHIVDGSGCEVAEVLVGSGQRNRYCDALSLHALARYRDARGIPVRHH